MQRYSPRMEKGMDKMENLINAGFSQESRCLVYVSSSGLGVKGSFGLNLRPTLRPSIQNSKHMAKP